MRQLQNLESMQSGFRGMGPLKQIEYGICGDLIVIYQSHTESTSGGPYEP